MRGSLRRGLALVRRRTPKGPPLQVRLYEKAGCGLCAETFRVLTRVRHSIPLDVERVDIERDPEVFRRFAIRIPVLATGGREVDAAGLDESAIARWLLEAVAR